MRRISPELLRLASAFVVATSFVLSAVAAFADAPASGVFPERYFRPPQEFVDQFGDYASPLTFDDGRPVENVYQWSLRRREIRKRWEAALGAWPPPVERPRVEIVASEPRENFTQHRVRVQVAPTQILDGYLLVPGGKGPFPAVVVPYYDAATGAGLGMELRDFGLQLTRRGFVSLSIGSPGGDARKPDLAGAQCQPLSYLGYIASTCYTVLAARPDVDPRRIGIVGHSYGGKWALFGSCLDERFACAVWSDPGIVFDEARGSVNYWEPWYLGYETGRVRKPGLVTTENPRTGPYATLVAERRNLHELHALMAPRPFLVSGGSEDFPARWAALNHTVAVDRLLGVRDRVAMTNRPEHPPTAESNEQIYRFFDRFLKSPPRDTIAVAHRGLLRETPENTLPNFTACLEAHLGFEFDVRRTRDGQLVCIHDDTLERTTDGSGPVAEKTLAELRRLDAGSWFADEFHSAKIPTIDEVLALVAAHPVAAGVYAVDLKADDAAVEADVVRLAQRHGVLDRLLFIGRAISHADVRRRLRAADRTCRTAAVVERREELSAAVADGDSDWVYFRYVPAPEDVAAVRAATKRALVAGPTVAGREEANWSRAVAAGVDAVLTDFPTEFRRRASGPDR